MTEENTMKIKYTALKSSSIGAIIAGLLAVSGQTSAADVNLPIWAGHFEQAYSSTSEQTARSTSVRSGASSSLKDHLIWAGQFKQAYGPPSQQANVTTGPTRYNVAEHLLWAGQLKQAYQAPHEEAGDEIRAIMVAMDRK
jgi:hypothetical protein